ncbi:MAG TPA: plastocyanin/azurin family copper-binding protein [Bacteroidales bacterium]|nr:plastocyanin/azurin family copper-binding protein [Bacteroidales bacterium]
MKAFIPIAVKSLITLIFSLLMVIVVQAQTTHQVSVADYAFNPDTLEIQIGDTVVWTNNLGSHNVNGTQATHAGNPASFGNDVGTGWTYTYVFTLAGTYDYQCDPHAGMGMLGQVIVADNGGGETSADITIDFSSMNPHLNQDLWLALVDQESGEIVQRVHDTVVTEAFSVVFADVETGRSYNVDFYADHNQSGNYNAPPEDHAWRLEVDNLESDTTLTFVHNTVFTDIEWKHAITLALTSMDPHIGQLLVVYIVNNENDTYVDTITIDEVTESNFDVVSYSVDTGGSYRIDFFADLNGNGTYDAPPADHAWRIEIETVNGDTTVPFLHNTDFTDIFETTGVYDREFEDVTLYPNPAGDYVRVSGNDMPSGVLSVRVLNLAGQIVLSTKATNNGNLVIDLTGLSKGVYYLLVESAGFSARAKFVKSF